MWQSQLVTAQIKGGRRRKEAFLASLLLASSSAVWLSLLLLLYPFTKTRNKLLWTYSMDWRLGALQQSSKHSFPIRTTEAASLMNLKLLITNQEPLSSWHLHYGIAIIGLFGSSGVIQSNKFLLNIYWFYQFCSASKLWLEKPQKICRIMLDHWRRKREKNKKSLEVDVNEATRYKTDGEGWS